MKIFTTRASLFQYLASIKKLNRVIGLVPTMGALHDGHLSLIHAAKQSTDVVVCSIFVNPTQFSELQDLEKYPRPIESDIEKLSASGCDVLFMPEVAEMYSDNENWHIDLNGLDEILEGAIRPGHYQGVTQIVKKLFDTVKPDKAFFGQKDYQQFMVISAMVKQFDLPVNLTMCPIVREADGLAMSSRNIHLSATEHQQALALNEALKLTKMLFQKHSISTIKNKISQYLANSPGIVPEYFSICHTQSLKPVDEYIGEKLVALVAARVGKIRLIDNIIIG